MVLYQLHQLDGKPRARGAGRDGSRLPRRDSDHDGERTQRKRLSDNLEAYVAIEYKTDQRGYIVKKRVAICDNKKFKKITLEIFNQVKTLKIATTEKIDTIYFQYKIQGSPTLIHSKVDVKIIGYGYNNKSILMK